MRKTVVQRVLKKITLDSLLWAFVWVFNVSLISALAAVVFNSVTACIHEDNDPNRSVEEKNVSGVKGFYQGHEYLFLCLKYENKCGVVHDPNCAKCHEPPPKTEQKSETKKKRYLVFPTVAEPHP